MMLTPIAPDALPTALELFAAGLVGDAMALAAFRRIAALIPAPDDPVDTPEQRAEACALAQRFGIATLDAEPASAFSWDGRVIRVRSEASVIVHEIAHWQLCPPDRRRLPDFGLGAGPETGRVAEADAARCVGEEERQAEESLASLLGILWEAELGHPAILAFLEQNWLEGYERPAAPAHFRKMLAHLRHDGFVDLDGRPLTVARGKAGHAEPAAPDDRSPGADWRDRIPAVRID